MSSLWLSKFALSFSEFDVQQHQTLSGSYAMSQFVLEQHQEHGCNEVY
jgi:hypothetical protein